MADQLNVQGVIPWFSRRVGNFMKSLAIIWYIELLILQTMYFFIHYLIVGQTIHNGSLYQAFLKMHLTAKFPRTLSTLLSAFNTDLFVHLPITTVVMQQYIMELVMLNFGISLSLEY
ncbi:hypothetical protein HanRHA438_Chr15g0690661 [Helianthus annuus]|uniref:Uncharacterized protein n=1 Tax=Helianthus annuus TaxID=4232 RepID=A0A9K3H3D1_HELAN|nr:hypothetical protein HanXRQr2_Chr15g0678311 [Helianthus annuus]KAJ0471951.1 hypothetical protein HanHA89_Chr15g0601661 [Helianthus annuus]KAJ0651429.1 hypothetical protein HanOQP8_Chr15g0560881 [Helianthus annuus]KAJ0830010.1 hypothetical protein HanPSC8_Chr15g0650331 [Helianthus annuus]KAJ0843372.1 hypothetical protein HanRHA438_Chr15g0690661 [Helianthus annuus]